MENSCLLTLTEKFKNRDMTAFPIIFGEFEKLMHIYSLRLGSEDAFEELTVFLLELLYGVDTGRFKKDSSDSFQRYIAVCLRNEYISLSKSFDDYRRSVLQLFDDERDNAPDFTENHILWDALAYLTKKEREIVIYKYIYGYTDVEIARFLNVTRQTVCNRKRRAVERLRKYYREEE